MKDTKLDIFRKKEITDLAIVAHQDDAEIIGFNGIINSFESSRRKFGTIVVTNGSGAKKISKYLEMSKEDYINKRNQEQLKAATIGKYSFVNFLKYESSELITQKDNVINDLKLIVKKLNPQNIYIHHPLDPHKTHMILSRLTLEAIKLLPKENRLNKIYAINLWGNNQIYLGKKTSFDMTNNALLIKELLSVYDSQLVYNNYLEGILSKWRMNAYLDISQVEKDNENNLIQFADDFSNLLTEKSLEEVIASAFSEFRDFHLQLLDT